MSDPLTAAVGLPTAPAASPPAADFWRRAFRHRSFVLGGFLVLLVIGSALLSLVWTP